MTERARKYMINTSSFPFDDAGGIFDEIERKFCVKYLGIYIQDGSMIIYIQFDNRIAFSNVEKILKEYDIGVEKISICKKFVGDDILSEKGDRPKPGGSSIRKRKHKVSPQPPTKLPVPAKNCLTLLDRVYDRTICGPADPNGFHAVWSSTNGLWYPSMWVGPIKNIIPVPRSSIHPRTINDLFEEQESKCRLCSTDVFMGTYSNSDVDHIVPLKHGGTCHEGNLQILCVTCHRRKTALECKKVVAIMGDDDVNWLDGNTYLTNTHVHFEPDSIISSSPKDALESFGTIPGLFILDG